MVTEGACLLQCSNVTLVLGIRLFGQVKGRQAPGCPRSSFNDVTVCDCQLRRIPKPYKDAQNRLLWRDKTCLARTWLVMSWKALLCHFIYLLLASELRHADM